jgi:ArsR family transcriptional regulator, arsenate/arsenite/antimonite-responsive transcriptional repressor
LKVLRKAGLVRGEKRGYWTHYSVNRAALARIAAKLNALAATDSLPSITCRRSDPGPADNHNPKEDEMCQNCCRQPDKLKDKPESCGPRQIRECHGDVKEHPCAQDKRDAEQK